MVGDHADASQVVSCLRCHDYIYIYIYICICGHCISCSALANKSHAKSSVKYLNLSRPSNIVNIQLVIMILIMKKNNIINSLFDSAYIWFVSNVTTVFVER